MLIHIEIGDSIEIIALLAAIMIKTIQEVPLKLLVNMISGAITSEYFFVSIPATIISNTNNSGAINVDFFLVNLKSSCFTSKIILEHQLSFRLIFQVNNFPNRYQGVEYRLLVYR